MRTILQSSIFRTAVLGLSASIVIGCAATPGTIDTSPEAEVTFDGLYPVKGGRMDQAWARKDLSAESYTKVMLQGVGVEYRPGGETRRRPIGNTTSQHYAVTAEQRAHFESEMREAFMEELAKGENFEIVTEPGPDVLLVRGGLLDVVSFVPPEPIGNADIYLSTVGEASLILEMRDSISGAILVRAVDRRAAEDSAHGFTRSNSVSNMVEFRRLARTWAGILRDGLDRFMAPGDEAGE
jgi:hypothetical protein